jgi:hypothetical protein
VRSPVLSGLSPDCVAWNCPKKKENENEKDKDKGRFEKSGLIAEARKDGNAEIIF